MLRKLMLVGMLVIAGRGSVAQLFLALVISFVSFSLQVKLTPYRHAEDNVLKAAVEMHIFLVKNCLCPVFPLPSWETHVRLSVPHQHLPVLRNVLFIAAGGDRPGAEGAAC